MRQNRFLHAVPLRVLGRWIAILAIIVCSGIAGPIPLAAAPAPASAGSSAAGSAPPSCLGANDLLVSGETIVISGTEVLDHLCVTKRGRIIGSGDVTLNVGVLYVDSSSAISLDGRGGGFNTSHDCASVDGGPNGSAGHSLAISADQATIEGSLSANGGRGIDYGNNCSSEVDAGHGGVGSALLLATRHLTLTGHLSAHGGNGGDATAPTYLPAYGPSRKPSGSGGGGGTITVSAPAGDLARLQGSLDVHGGHAGKPGHGGSGKAGRDGTVHTVHLTQAAAAALPPEPAPLLALAASAPAFHVVPASRTEQLPCGPRDLVVPAGTTRTLSGVQQFTHICVGGMLRGTGTLTLVAQTIAIAHTGEISLDGRSPLPFQWSDSGRYLDKGGCTGDRGDAHAGLRGPAVEAAVGATFISTAPYLTPRPGEGGGRLTMIAATLAIEGRVHANGGAGQSAYAVTDVDGTETWAGAGGGSGGGIIIYAQHLVLDGQIAAIGGAGGKGSGPGHIDGPHGSGGCVKVFADVIDSAQTLPAIAGSAFAGVPSAADPVAPPAQLGGSIYVAATHHTLGEPFLGYWRGHGGLATLGYPLTEAFTEHGLRQQYTERALLIASGGSVRTVALGSSLTASRHFARLSQAAAGARYFAATGHSLGGRFFAYWLGHQGASVLGAPISEVLDEGNGDGSGRRYMLQWFERGRLEYHPENAGAYAMQLGLVGRDALRARGWLPPLAVPTVTPPVDPEAGRLPGAKHFALEANGDIFESDGSTAWHYRWGTTPDPARCAVADIASTADGTVVYVSSSGASIGGLSPASGTCVLLWHDVHGSLQPVPVGELPDDAGSDMSHLLVSPDGHMVYVWKWAVGLAKSSDGGATWTRAASPGRHVVDGFVMDPGRPERLWLQVSNGSPPPGFHLYRSDDAGGSWLNVPTGGTPIGVGYPPVPMAIDPQSTAALWIGSEHGLFHTVDGGKTWEHAEGGLPATMPVTGLAISPFDPHRMLAWRQGAGLFSSGDGGRTWMRSPGTFSGGYDFRATFDRLDHRHIYLACSAGVYASGDGGRTWSKGAGIASATSVIASTGHPGLAYLVGRAHQLPEFLAQGQVFRTTDGGATWHAWSGGDMPASDVIVGTAGFVP